MKYIYKGNQYKNNNPKSTQKGLYLLDELNTNVNNFDPLNYPERNGVVLYLKGDGINNSSTVLDYSPYPKLIENRFDNIKISTTQFKYGGSSLFWPGGDGSNGTTQWLQLNDKTNIKDIWEDQTVDYTVEFWIYPLRFGFNDINSIMDIGGLTDIGGEIRIVSDKIGLFAYDNGSIYSNTNILLNVWQHIALVRKSGVWSLFFNGILDNVQTLTNVTTGPWDAFIGKSNSTIESYFYLDSLRLIKGYALYASNFNPNTETSLIY